MKVNPTLPATRNIVRQLLELSKDPDNQVMIAKESGCVDGLVGYLDSSDEQVVLLASKAIQYLSSNPLNKEILCAHPQLLNRVVDQTTRDNQGIAEICRLTLDNLVSHVNRQSHSSLSEQTNPSEKKAVNERIMRTVSLRTFGIRDENVRSIMEQKLVLVHGVVSVTLDQNKEVAVVYARDYDGLLSKLEQAVQEVDTMRDSKVDLAFQRKILPQYIDVEKLFPKGAATISKAGGSTLLKRLEDQKNQVELKRQRHRRVTRILGKVGQGVGRGLSAFGIW